MGAFKTWSAQDIKYLKNSLGKVSIEDIANNLNRTEKAVKSKAIALNLVNRRSISVHYQRALPPEQWPRAEAFLKMMAIARDHAKATGERPDINLSKLQGAMATGG